MLVLDYAGVWGFSVSVVYDGIALPVGSVKGFLLEADCSIIELPEAVTIELVDFSGEDDFIGLGGPVVPVFEEVDTGAALDAFEETVDKAVVPSDRDALICVIEIVVVEDEAHREALYDESGQFAAGAAPLFFGVALDKLFIDVPADEQQRLLFKIARLLCAAGLHPCNGFCLLLLNLCGSLLRSDDTPHTVEGVHIEREVVEFAFVVGYRTVSISVEGDDGIDEVPYLFV